MSLLAKAQGTGTCFFTKSTESAFFFCFFFVPSFSLQNPFFRNPDLFTLIFISVDSKTLHRTDARQSTVPYLLIMIIYGGRFAAQIERFIPVNTVTLRNQSDYYSTEDFKEAYNLISNGKTLLSNTTIPKRSKKKKKNLPVSLHTILILSKRATDSDSGVNRAMYY